MINNRLSLLFFALWMIISCNKLKDESFEAKEQTYNESAVKDTFINNVKSNDKTKNINNDSDDSAIDNLLKKIKGRESLNSEEYAIISKYALENNDEAASEEIGYLLFQYFRNDKKKNDEFILFLGKEPKAYQIELLNKLVELMCIDFGEEKYTYERLVIDFQFFDKQVTTKAVFNACMENQVYN